MMRTRGLIRRAIAFQLLIALPAVAGARLALDIRSAPEIGRHIEAQHGESCAKAHDHSLCILVFNTPWSAASPVPLVQLTSPPVVTATLADSTCHGCGQVRLALARAPPSFTLTA